MRALADVVNGYSGNVQELVTGLECAPMSGHSLFRASGLVSLTPGGDSATLIAVIENPSDVLTVDISRTPRRFPHRQHGQRGSSRVKIPDFCNFRLARVPISDKPPAPRDDSRNPAHPRNQANPTYHGPYPRH